MAPRENENKAYAKFGGDKQRTLWYAMVFSGVVNTRYIHESFTSNVTRLRIPASHGQRQSASVVKDLISKDRQQTQLAARAGL